MDNNDANVRHRFDGNCACAFNGQEKAKIIFLMYSANTEVAFIWPEQIEDFFVSNQLRETDNQSSHQLR